MADKVLKYVGKEKGILPGVPAKDLTYKEVKMFGGYNYLISTGLYERVEQEKPKRTYHKKDKQESDE
jgi:hypothetical protein